MAAAADTPSRVEALFLISPAGLPLSKPISRSVRSFSAQLARGRYPVRQAARAAARVAAAPRSALRLALGVRDLDLSPEMTRIRRKQIPATVVACATDTLVTVRHCRAAARLLGAVYRELDLPGGHMWMLDSWPTFRRELLLAHAAPSRR
jgi:pimeloyl-ACP methyl ester carboxylesterase